MPFSSRIDDKSAELSNDPIIRSHLAALYDTLLEQNLLRVIEPFSRVEIQHVADLVKLPTSQVETKYVAGFGLESDLKDEADRTCLLFKAFANDLG